MTEHRAVTAEVRQKGPRTIEAKVMTYDVVDDYQTIFDSGCFTASLTSRLPRLCFSHDWTEPIGRATTYSDTNKALNIVFELDDPSRVPTADRVLAQLESGTLDQFSVGFARQEAYEDDQGVTHFKKARLDEVSVVLAGAVPGTELLSVRSADRRHALAEQLRDGKISMEQYKAGVAFAEDLREADEILAKWDARKYEMEAQRQAADAQRAVVEGDRYQRERRFAAMERDAVLTGVVFVKIDPAEARWDAWRASPYYPWIPCWRAR